MTRIMIALFSMLLLAGCENSTSGKAGGAPNYLTSSSQSGSGSEQGHAIGCERFSPGGRPPQIQNEKLAAGVRGLCYRAFSVGYSTVSRTPLWSAEYITRDSIELAHRVPRIDLFHPDDQLASSERSELSDYVNSGFDRGHMAPNGDMPTSEAAAESFTLANIVPQAAGLNRHSWADLEKAVRRQTRGGPVFIVTGPLFVSNGGALRTTHRDQRVFIPSHTYKAIYAQDRGATVFVATNEDRPHWTNMTVAQFTQVYKINPFPGMLDKFRNVNGALDGSLMVSGGRRRGSADSAGELGPNTRIRDSRTHQIMDLQTYHLFYPGKNPSPEEIESN